jgi:hypothetical protein
LKKSIFGRLFGWNFGHFWGFEGIFWGEIEKEALENE